MLAANVDLCSEHPTHDVGMLPRRPAAAWQTGRHATTVSTRCSRTMTSADDALWCTDAGASRQGRREGSYVLVVEADAGLGRALRQGLAGAGYAVRLVPDGWAALLAVLDGVPAALVAGCTLPVMAGWELHHLLQGAELRIPVVDLSHSGAVHAATTPHYATQYLATRPEPAAVIEALARVVPSA